MPCVCQALQAFLGTAAHAVSLIPGWCPTFVAPCCDGLARRRTGCREASIIASAPLELSSGNLGLGAGFVLIVQRISEESSHFLSCSALVDVVPASVLEGDKGANWASLLDDFNDSADTIRLFLSILCTCIPTEEHANGKAETTIA